MHKLLQEGQFPPRWSADLYYSYGYPVFLFNYPMPAIIGEVFVLTGFGYVGAVKAVLLLSMVISLIGMYFFANELLASKLSAVVAALFYLYAPIRFIDVYVSAAVGASLALAFVPFIFWCILKLNKSFTYVLAGGVFLALLITSHNVTALMFAPAIMGFSVIYFIKSKYSRREFIRLILMFVFGLGLSAWFWLPATWEKQYIIYDTVMKDFYLNHFPTLKQLIYSPWGYGLSHPGSLEDGMSFQIGLVHIAVVALSLLSLIWLKKKAGMLTWWVYSLGLFTLSVFLMLEVSIPVWKIFPLLDYVQLPFKFLAAAVFSAAILAGLLVKFLPHRVMLSFLLMTLVLVANRNHVRINQIFDPGESYYLSLQGSSTSFNEHLPIWASYQNHNSPGKFEALTGKISVKYFKNYSDTVEVQVESPKEAVLRFNQFYFPGWKIYLDGKFINLNLADISATGGFPVFSVPPGKHQVKALFANTLIRSIADWLSAITVISCVLYCLVARRPNNLMT